MGTVFLVNGTLPNGRVWLNVSEQPFAQGDFPHQVRSLRLYRQPVDFLVWLRRLLIAFQTNSRHALKQCFQSNRYARQTRTTKICQRSARTSGEICTLIVEGDSSVQIGCSTLLAAPFVERCTRQKKRASKYTSNLYRLRKQRSFPHDRHLPGRDTPSQAFGEIFADFSSIAIARDALFEHGVRVCGKSNP